MQEGITLAAPNKKRGRTNSNPVKLLYSSPRGCDITRSAVAKIEVGQRHIYPDEIILLTEILSSTFDEIFNLS